MRTVARIGLAVALVAAGCAGQPAASPTPAVSDFPGAGEALYAENRGGPDLVLVVGTAPEVPLPCGAEVVLRPGEAGMPDLPWDFEAREAGSGRSVHAQEGITELPRWFVQIGDQVVGGGLRTGPVEGTAGPPC